ncbi:universal stress protein [Nocardia sp. NBC_01730]|uniref:universal stress protein n=1 Tax=Nocardia sp. NBC_01730 TaxID=2975998 RepID=UPI002E0F3C8B|nr:universal stress protein [Nocardia sp. NBC_01730]
MTEQRYHDPHRLPSARVVVGVDGSQGSETALRWAADFAAKRERELQIVHGMDLVGMGGALGSYEVVVPSVVDSVRAHGKAVVARAERVARETEPGLRVSTLVTTDSAKQLLIDHSAEAYAVVVGATGSANTFAHLGSTLLALTAHAHGTLVVVRTDPEADHSIHSSGPVVVGIDGSPISETAIAAAFAEAAERCTDLVAVHVWSDWDSGQFAGPKDRRLLDAELEQTEQAILAERLAGWQEKYPDVRVIRKIYLAAPAARLQVWSKSAQLVVVGSRGRGGFVGMLLGSTANSLVQHASCPVMVVHPAQ